MPKKATFYNLFVTSFYVSFDLIFEKEEKNQPPAPKIKRYFKFHDWSRNHGISKVRVCKWVDLD